MDTPLPETPLTNETEEEQDDLFPDIYVEKSSKVLFEVKFFDGFCLVRPATPMFYTAIRKISLDDFTSNFEEFLGDLEEVRDALRGMTPELIVDFKH